ncbi:MAG: ABC transporter ATP-binding protein [Bariatricus sp.]
MSSYILEMNHIGKIYGNGVVANSDVNFKLKKGEIHALVGENGAGKSTLMKILFGMEQPSRGEIILKGKKTTFSGSKEAIANGIGMVHQHFMLVESFTVAQNIVLGMEPKKGVFVDNEQAVKFTKEMGEKYNLPVDPTEVTRNLPVGVKQKVEILKALSRGAEILILDEPTAVLTPQETEQLFEELKQLKKQGHTIVFISHKIPEIKQICDRITVMRSGRTIETYQCDEVTEQQISNAIMGCELNTSIDRHEKKYGRVNVQVEHLSYKDKNGVQILRDVSFSMRQGMIFGIAGVQGNGQVELVDILTRKRAVQIGEVKILGEKMDHINQKQIRSMSFGYIPEDRLEQGVAASIAIDENMIANDLDSTRFQKRGVLNFKRINEFVKNNIKNYEIRCAGGTQPVGMLSGGNMQKVVVARECGNNPSVLIAEQPTRGVDVGAAHIIHKKIVQLCEQGSSVLLVSADLSELLKLSDVLAVMYEGEMVAFFENTEGLNEEKLGLYMLGIEKHSEEQIRKAVVSGE